MDKVEARGEQVGEICPIFRAYGALGFNGSVNIPESYDFRSQFLILNIIFSLLS